MTKCRVLPGGRKSRPHLSRGVCAGEGPYPKRTNQQINDQLSKPPEILSSELFSFL